MKTKYQAINPTTGQRGPDDFDSATAASLWILKNHAHERGWEWRQVDAPRSDSTSRFDHVPATELITP